MVRNGIAEKCDIAAVYGGDGAQVDHRARGAVSLEDVFSGIEVLVGDVQCAGHETGGIESCTPGKAGGLNL